MPAQVRYGILPGSRMPAGSPFAIAHIDAESGFSGGEIQVFLLMEGLRARGHRGVLLAPPGSSSESEARRLGLEVRAVPMRGDLDLPAILRLRRELLGARVDLAHLHTGRATWLGGLAARWAGIPAVTTRRQEKTLARSVRTRFVYGSLVRRAVAISPAVALCLERGGVERSRLVTIPSSVDPARLHAETPRDEMRARLGLGADEFVVLTLAALVHRKGVDLLLEALHGLAGDGVLLIAGDGAERRGLERQAAALGLGERVRFLGARADKAELLGACDVFALASRAEGLGVAALEAMACGRAVVATRVGGLMEAVVDGRTGLLVEPEDPRALGAALARLRDDPALRERLGGAGPQRLREGFVPEQMVGAYEALYREVLTEAAQPSAPPAREAR